MTETAIKGLHWSELVPDGNEFDEKELIAELSDLLETQMTNTAGCIAVFEVLTEGICADELRKALMQKPPDALAIQTTVHLLKRLQNALRGVLDTDERKRIHGIRAARCRDLACKRRYAIIG